MKKSKKLKVLVVEDCPSDVYLLEHMLQESKAQQAVSLTHVPRLIDAFQRIDDETFDVILLDLNLLDMDGVASVAALSAEVPATPILVYSGTENHRVQKAAMMCGARGYLVKGHENGRSLQHALQCAVRGIELAQDRKGRSHARHSH